MNSTAPAFLQKLREYTTDLHTALEDLPISKSITSPDILKEEYSLYLKLMYEVIADTEQNIYPILQEIISDMDNRYKSKYLQQDLNNLNVNAVTNSNPVSSNITDNSTAFALGIMYVVEGSSLGGRVILKNIQSALGYDENNGARYFAGYGQTTGSSWKNFLAMMTEYQEKTQSEAQIIAGANYAFNAIAKHLKDNSSN